MSLHELCRMAKGKLDSKEMNATCAIDQSSAPQNDFLELFWENGQISMLGQSSRVRKIPTCKSLPSQCLPSHTPKGQDKDVGYANNANANATNIRMVKFGDLDTGLNEIRMPVEEVIPWLNYGMDESLQHDYSSDFLHELSGVTMNDLSPSNNFSLLDKRSNCNHVFMDSHKNPSEQGILSKGTSVAAREVENHGTKASTSQLYPPSSSHQCQTSFASVRHRVSDMTENNTSNATQHAPCVETTQIPSASSDFSSLKMEEKQDPIMSSNSSTIMNFSHFARHAAIVKANLQNIDMGNKSKVATAATRSNPPESTKVWSGECPKETGMHSQQVMEPSKVDLNPLEAKSLQQNAAVSKQFDPTCKEDVSKIDHTSNLVLGESGIKEQEDVEKRMEPAVPSSSVCSGNGAERCSDDRNQNLKRKGPDTEDSECQSEDVEEESFGVQKARPARGAMGSKRSRSAEVHNLSERRRRDRINEKMRALQELIPNCNKVDKASMLDEAIEYLKTLQLQVQIMSMGAGLYMPTMMLPAGMQHMHAPHMAPFSPMGVVGMQMGLGMGCGMRMPDINSGSSRFPMVQVPQMQGTHLPAAHISGSTALHGIARSNPEVFGLPSQGLPMPMPRGPLFPFPGEPLMNSSSLGLNACATAGLMETVDLASASSLKNPMPNVSSQVMQNTNGRNSACQMSNQCEARTGGFEHSALVPNSGHASEANNSGAVNASKEDNLMINKSCEL